MEPVVPDYLRLPTTFMTAEVVTNFNKLFPAGSTHMSVEVRATMLPGESVAVVHGSSHEKAVRPGSYLIHNDWLGRVLERSHGVWLIYDGLDEAIIGRQEVRDDYSFDKVPRLLATTQACEMMVLDAYRCAQDPQMIERIRERGAQHVLSHAFQTFDEKFLEALGFMWRSREVNDCRAQFNPRHIPLQSFAVMRRVEGILKRLEGIDLYMESQILAMTGRLNAILAHYADLKRIAESPLNSARALGPNRDHKATLAIAEDLEKNAVLVELIADLPFRHSAKHIAREMHEAADALRNNRTQMAQVYLQRMSRVLEGILNSFLPFLAYRRDLMPIVRFNLETNAGDRTLLMRAAKNVRDILLTRDYDDSLEGFGFANHAIRCLQASERHVADGDFAKALEQAKIGMAGY